MVCSAPRCIGATALTKQLGGSMARPERVGTTQSTVSYHGLRDWLDQVEKLGELQKVNGAHWDREMGAITQMLTETRQR